MAYEALISSMEKSVWEAFVGKGWKQHPSLVLQWPHIAAREAGNVSLDSCVPIMMEGGEEIRWGNSKPLSVIKYFR